MKKPGVKYGSGKLTRMLSVSLDQESFNKIDKYCSDNELTYSKFFRDAANEKMKN